MLQHFYCSFQYCTLPSEDLKNQFSGLYHTMSYSELRLVLLTLTHHKSLVATRCMSTSTSGSTLPVSEHVITWHKSQIPITSVLGAVDRWYSIYFDSGLNS